MDLKEVNELSILDERRHWWIRTRFNYIDRALSLIKKKSINILEFGCGTGQNLWYARTESPYLSMVGDMRGVDPGLQEEIHFDWQTNKDSITSSLSSDDIKGDCLLAMDVLEHIEDDREALQEWVGHLNSDAIVLLTVPAFQHLWSYHDVFLEHKRRYTKKSLVKLAKESGLEPIKVSYAFGYLNPVVFLIRKLFTSSENKSDLTLPHPFVNKVLQILGKIESSLGGCPWFGTSVIGVFKKSE
jgi:SAM-dependent methyltransferase